MYPVSPLDWLGSTHTATLSYFFQPVGSLDDVDHREAILTIQPAKRCLAIYTGYSPLTELQWLGSEDLCLIPGWIFYFILQLV